MRDLCRLMLTGRLTRDPELRHTAGGTAVCGMRVAYSTSRKDESGSWVDKPNYIDVSVFGNQGEKCAEFLAKGRQVAIDGRLEWREWEPTDGGPKRQAYDLIADSVIFLGKKEDGGGTYVDQYAPSSGGSQTAPAGDFPPAQPDDDIPF